MLDTIFEKVKSELLTEEVKSEISTLFEAKVQEAVKEKTEKLEEETIKFKEQEKIALEEKAVQYVDDVLLNKIDEYLDFVADEYMKENSIAIENGLKASMYDKLAESIKTVLSTNSLVEEKVEEQENLFNTNKELKSELNESMKETVELRKQIKGLKAVHVFNSITEGLSVTQKEKVKELSEDYDIDDVDSFKSKLTILVENISKFETKSSTNKETEQLNENFGGDWDEQLQPESNKILQNAIQNKNSIVDKAMSFFE
jgi:hypothetical protein